MITYSQFQPQQNTAPALEDLREEYACRRCGVIATHCQRPGTHPHHARSICEACGVFIRWLPKPRTFKGKLPPTDQQLRYLRLLGHDGPEPQTRLLASEAISRLKSRES
jgi:hypothetical protein